MLDKISRMQYLPGVDEQEIGLVLARWASPELSVFAMLPEAEKANLKRVQSACALKGVSLCGGIFPALINEGEFCTSGVWLLAFEQRPYVALYENLPEDADAAQHLIEQITTDLRKQIDHQPDLTLFMLFDAMVPNISSMLDWLYLSLANRMHYAGANAGSETFQPMPCLFDGERIVQKGLLLLLLNRHKGAILEHGYRAPERTVYATSTTGNLISQIDWRPAFEVYQELVRTQYGVEITQTNFYEHAVHYPFGIIRANHHVVVRIPVMLNDNGGLFCVGEIPPNSVLTLLERPSVDTNETLRVLTEGLTALNGDLSHAELLLFYCAGRRMHLGAEAATTELREFSRRAKAAKICGAVSLGEIGGSTLHGYPLFHNATLVGLNWSS